MWKKCVTGSYDYCDEDDNAMFHIFRTNLLETEKYAGQVFMRGDQSEYSELVYEKSLPLFITKCIVKANEFGWNIDFSMVDLNPDFKSLPEYKSNMYKEHFADTKLAKDPRFSIDKVWELAGIGSEPTN